MVLNGKECFCGLQCGDTLTTSGTSGVYYIPFLKNSGNNRVDIKITTYSVPDDNSKLLNQY